jgi:phospholipid/cholesterol/gamma-HCH transport system ATP-binding protein
LHSFYIKMESVIRVKNLSVGYGARAVLNDLRFSVPKGQISVMLGPSGCGKTTVLKTIIGLIPAISGEIYLFGDQAEYGSERYMNNLYLRIGVLYQRGALLNSLTLYDNVALPLKLHHSQLPPEIEKEMVFSRLSQVGLQGDELKYPSELSEGMKKRAALARAMILGPDVIFCDEPSAGLDPITATELDELLIKMKKLFGMTIVVVTHELRSIEKIADRAIVLHNHGLYFDGELNELLSLKDEFINRFFLKGNSNA